MAVVIRVQKEHPPCFTLAEDGGRAVMACIGDGLHRCPWIITCSHQQLDARMCPRCQRLCIPLLIH